MAADVTLVFMTIFPVHPDLRIEGFSDADLLGFLDGLAPRGGPGRYAAWPKGEGWHMVRAGSADETHSDDPAAVCGEAGVAGVCFDTEGFEAFLSRFPNDMAHTTVGRLAALIAPVLPDLHPGAVRGLGWDLKPADRTQRILEIASRFLPKERAVAVRLASPARPRGIALIFDRRRLLVRVAGPQAWPESVLNGATLADLKPAIGCPVEVGLDIGSAGLHALLFEQLNRAAFADLFAAGELRLDPLPLAARLALKAARLT